MTLVKAEDIGTAPSRPTQTSRVPFGDLTVGHTYHADDDLHTFIWWDEGAVTRMTARSFGPDLPDHLLSSLVSYDISDQIVQAMVIPEEAAVLVGDGERPLAWGTAATTTWVLVGWESVVEGKPTLTCTGVRPVVEEDWCTVPDGPLILLQAFTVGDGAVLVLRNPARSHAHYRRSRWHLTNPDRFRRDRRLSTDCRPTHGWNPHCWNTDTTRCGRGRTRRSDPIQR